MFIGCSKRKYGNKMVALCLSEKLFFLKSEDVKDTDFFVDCIEKIESIFTLLPTLQKTEKKN